MLPDRNSFYKNAIAFEFCLGFTLISLGSQAPNQYNVDSNTKVRFFLREIMARNRGQSAADVADATRAAFHLTASAHPTKIKHQKMSEITFYKALDRLSTADFLSEILLEKLLKSCSSKKLTILFFKSNYFRANAAIYVNL